MRKDVKRARLWLINQLAHKAKRLSAKKVQNDQQKAKNERKTERHLEEIKILKHIDIDDVSKYALCHTINSTQNNLESMAVEQRAMLRLAMHKFVQNQVTKFRENNPIALDKLVLLIRSLGLKYQKKKNLNEEENLSKTPKSNKKDVPGKVKDLDHEEQPPKAKKLKSESKTMDTLNHSATEEDEGDKSEANEDSYISEEQPMKEDENEVSEENSTSETEQVKESDTEQVEGPDTEQVEGSDTEQTERSDPEQVERPDAEQVKEPETTAVTKATEKPKNKKPEKKASKIQETGVKTKKDLTARKKIAWPESKNFSIDKREGTMLIKQLNLEKLQDSEELTFEEPEDSFFIHKRGSELPRSSFFVGGIDEVEPEPATDNVKDNSHFSRRWDSEETRGNSKPHNDRFNKKPAASSNFNRNKPKDRYPVKPGKFIVIKLCSKELVLIHLDHLVSVESEKIDTNLHPAWLAKKNLQKAQKIEINLNSGQGKKITFGDD